MSDVAKLDPHAQLESAAKQARSMRRVTEILIPLLVAAIALPLIGGVYLALFEGRGGVVGALIHIIAATPAICAAMAVIGLHGVISEYTAGRMLSAAASDGFRRAGVWALAAFLLKLSVVPLLTAFLGGPAFDWRFDALDIALMAFAALLLMIGTVIQAAAAALKAENDQIV
ncbi:MAG: hypothetical protein J0L81_06115 [Caulobacterales bacterium]|jgi:hypothetical protein|nr:hypothetical protein [Caulobacterales bacterium]